MCRRDELILTAFYTPKSKTKLVVPTRETRTVNVNLTSNCAYHLNFECRAREHDVRSVLSQVLVRDARRAKTLCPRQEVVQKVEGLGYTIIATEVQQYTTDQAIFSTTKKRGFMAFILGAARYLPSENDILDDDKT